MIKRSINNLLSFSLQEDGEEPEKRKRIATGETPRKGKRRQQFGFATA